MPSSIDWSQLYAEEDESWHLDWRGLSREHEVLELLAAGRTNREIAETLFITENRAGVHVSHILGKLGVTRRAEAAAIAGRTGMLDN